MVALSGDHAMASTLRSKDGSDLGRLTRRAVVAHQPPAIGLHARLRLRVEGDPLAVGRIGRRAVEAGAGRDLLRRCSSVCGNGEDVAVRARRFHRIDDGREGDLFPVGRERDRVRAFALQRRHVVVGAGRQILRRSAVDGDDEQVSALAVSPLRPVAVEQGLGDVRLDLAVLGRLRALRVAGVVLAVRVDLRRERDPLAVGRPDDVVGAAGEGGEPRGLAARERHRVDRGVAVAARHEGEALAVRRPPRAVVLAAGGDLPRRAAGCRDDPDVADARVPRTIRRRHGVDDGGAVGEI